MTVELDVPHLQSWTGKQETIADLVTPFPVTALAATIEAPYAPQSGVGDSLPPLWHWLYFLPLHAQSSLGPDGHARRGGFLPPVPLPRRMWAGGRLEFASPLRVGDAITRVSTIKNVDVKRGRSGNLVFVTVCHEVQRQGELLLTEEHDIVYRDAPAPGAPAPEPTLAPGSAPWSRPIVPDDVLLFRYSALTFNGHRIHYDRRYVTEVEGYPGLVVHGPLIATLLIDLVLREQPRATVKSFRFRALRPVFDLHPFRVCARPGADGKTIALWAKDHEGWLTMDAVATLG
jgi:3-methylfumaryl-CoA hydratase